MALFSQAYRRTLRFTGRHEAWIENLARHQQMVDAAADQRVRAFAEAGFSHAMIAVDTDNLTGAARLYRRLGFERERRSVTHEIEL